MSPLRPPLVRGRAALHRPHRPRLRRARRPLRARRAAARRRPRRRRLRARPPRPRAHRGRRAWSRTARRSPRDLHDVADAARAEHPGLPVALIGHSMGGLIATRYAQRYGDELDALVLSGPAIGGNPAFEQLLAMDPIPEVPIDPARAVARPERRRGLRRRRARLPRPVPARDARAAVRRDRARRRGRLVRRPADALDPRLGRPDRPAGPDAPGDRHAPRAAASASTSTRAHGTRSFNETNRDEVLTDVVGFLRSAL